jgi:hypothetical protein
MRPKNPFIPPTWLRLLQGLGWLSLAFICLHWLVKP